MARLRRVPVQVRVHDHRQVRVAPRLADPLLELLAQRVCLRLGYLGKRRGAEVQARVGCCGHLTADSRRQPGTCGGPVGVGLAYRCQLIRRVPSRPCHPGRRYPLRDPHSPGPGPRAHRPGRAARPARVRRHPGLAWLGAYHLSSHPDHQVTRDVLSYLVRLTEPLPGADGLPWWASVAPSGEPSPDYPDGHGNLGLSHGIGSVLAVLSLALLRGLTVPRMADAAGRICAWTDQWRRGGNTSWWPGFITIEQAREHHVDP